MNIDSVSTGTFRQEMEEGLKRRSKFYSIAIGALFALMAFMLVIVSMNMFGHRDSAPHEQVRTNKLHDSVENSSFAHVASTPSLKTTADGSECSISDSVLSDTDLQKLANNKNLRTLNLTHCTFAGKLSAQLTAQTIHVSNSDIDANAVDFIALSPLIKCAEFFSCEFHPLSLHALRSSKIAWLQIRNSKVLTTDNSFCAADIADIVAMPHLVHLELERSQIAANTLGEINKSAVQVANLRDCDLNDSDLANISKSPRLQYINILSNSKLSDTGVEQLLRAPNIRQIKCDLDLSKLKLTDLERKKLDSASYHVPGTYYDK